MMSVTFYIPGYLRAFTDGNDRVEIDTAPATVGEALEALSARHPGVRDRVLTERGQVRMHVNVFVGSENIRYTGGLDTALSDGSEVSIVPAVSGGKAQLQIADCRLQIEKKECQSAICNLQFELWWQITLPAY
jgi:MoaD family protein